MPLLILSMLRAIWTLRRDPQFASLALLAAVAIVSGTGFYSLVEGLRFVDALYFSVVTLTTVGYGDFAPQTDVGKLFTAVYALVGIGILLAFVTTLAAKMSQTSPLHPFARSPAPGGGDDAAAGNGSPPPSNAAFVLAALALAAHASELVARNEQPGSTAATARPAPRSRSS
jgi:voltage-gated potassium channel